MAQHADPSGDLKPKSPCEPVTPAFGAAGGDGQSDPALGGNYRVVTFRVQLRHREKQLHFKIGATVAEAEACMKIKLCEDDVGNTFFMKLVLRKELMSRPDAVRHKINTELGVLKILDHIHIIKLFQVFSSEEIVYVLMERVRRPLSRRMAEVEGGLSEEDAQYYFRQLVSAVVYLHGRGLAHRDLCLSNLAIDMDTNMVKITGFGSACIQTTRSMLKTRPASLTDESYAAPELMACPEAKPGEESDPRTPLDASHSRSSDGGYHGKKADIWSLGCIVHTMLCGSPPWPAGAPPGDPATLPIEGVSDEARSCVRLMLNLDWSKRINTQELSEHPWVVAEGAVARCATDSDDALAKSTGAELQKSFAKVGELKLGDSKGSGSITSVPSVPKIDSVESQPIGRPAPLKAIGDTGDEDGCDDSFSPLGKAKKQPLEFALLMTPDDKEIQPLWGEDDLMDMQLSPKAAGTPSARTRRMIDLDILQPDSQVAGGDDMEASPMGRDMPSSPERKAAVAKRAKQLAMAGTGPVGDPTQLAVADLALTTSPLRQPGSDDFK